jgi:hypothetical protein
VKAVTVDFSIPCCASRVVSVAPIMVYGKPDETPRRNAAMGAASA